MSRNCPFQPRFVRVSAVMLCRRRTEMEVVLRRDTHGPRSPSPSTRTHYQDDNPNSRENLPPNFV